MFIGRGHACERPGGEHGMKDRKHCPRNDMWHDDGGNTST